jgi:phosphoenolpyruvate carboxykinase (ATP)
MVKAVLTGALNDASWQADPVFGISVPNACPGVPSEILQPRQTWKDPAAYDRKALELAKMFAQNFQENAPDAPAEIKAAGPKSQI